VLDELVDFARALDAAGGYPGQATQVDPDLIAAYELYADPDAETGYLVALRLSGESPEQIAAETHFASGVVKWFTCFFDPMPWQNQDSWLEDYVLDTHTSTHQLGWCDLLSRLGVRLGAEPVLMIGSALFGSRGPWWTWYAQDWIPRLVAWRRHLARLADEDPIAMATIKGLETIDERHSYSKFGEYDQQIEQLAFVVNVLAGCYREYSTPQLLSIAPGTSNDAA
jgi:hypothetical protein